MFQAIDEADFEERRRAPRPPQWHLDKKVPIGLIVAIVFQTCSFIWWTSELNSTIKDHERRLLIAEAFENRIDGDTKTISERLGRLEERSTSTLSSIQRIENILERQEERRAGR